MRGCSERLYVDSTYSSLAAYTIHMYVCGWRLLRTVWCSWTHLVPPRMGKSNCTEFTITNILVYLLIGEVSDKSGAISRFFSTRWLLTTSQTWPCADFDRYWFSSAHTNHRSICRYIYIIIYKTLLNISMIIICHRTCKYKTLSVWDDPEICSWLLSELSSL